MPVDSKINYFLLAEFGNNGLTAPGNSFTKLTDASLTFSHFMRFAFNYELAEAEAPNFPTGAGPNDNLDGIADRFAIQITGIFSQ